VQSEKRLMNFEFSQKLHLVHTSFTALLHF